MAPWRGILCHVLMASAQPIYIAARSWLDAAYLSRDNGIWLAIGAVSWTYLVLKVTIPFFTNPLRDLPCPPIDIFPIGHFDTNGGKPVGENVDRMLKTPNDGLINLWMPLYLGCQVIPTKPETVMEMLNTHSYDWEKPMLEKRLLSGLIGQGLVSVDGQEHKDMRRAVAPAFSGRTIRDLAPLFHTKAIKSNDYIASEAIKAEGSVVEITTLMSRITLDIICAAAIGQDFDAVEGTDASLAQIYDEVTHADRGPSWLFVLLLLMMPMSWFGYMKGTPYAKLHAQLARLRAKIRMLLAEKKSTIEKQEKDQEKDIIAIIMRSGNFSDDYLADQLLTFLSAG
jgi:cytochrome P450